METEVTNISSHGLWILSNDKEFFLSYENFPWFKDKTINDITKVETFGQGHLYWENLDVDLTKNPANENIISYYWLAKEKLLELKNLPNDSLKKLFENSS